MRGTTEVQSKIWYLDERRKISLLTETTSSTTCWQEIKYLPRLFWAGRVLHRSLNLTGWYPSVITKWWEKSDQSSRRGKDFKWSLVKTPRWELCYLSLCNEVQKSRWSALKGIILLQWDVPIVLVVLKCLNEFQICVNSSPTCQGNIPSGAALAYLFSSRDAPIPLTQNISTKNISAIQSIKKLTVLTSFEDSPSSRLVGIGTTTWELEALSSVTEPCNRLSSANM